MWVEQLRLGSLLWVSTGRVDLLEVIRVQIAVDHQPRLSQRLVQPHVEVADDTGETPGEAEVRDGDFAPAERVDEVLVQHPWLARRPQPADAQAGLPHFSWQRLEVQRVIGELEQVVELGDQFSQLGLFQAPGKRRVHMWQ
eukprot:scaffold305_cov247-Pinguiococcus_pyrenoidosus.AAC.11